MAMPLRILAGPRALAEIRERGLRLDDVDVLVGAAGGTKFLLLGGLDRVLFAALRARCHTRAIHCVGASIGAWRLACLACDDPCAALDRLAEAYIEARAPIGRAHLDELAASILRAALGGERRATIVDHAFVRLHVLANRCEGLTASDHPAVLLTGLGLAALGNFVSRRTLAWHLTRVVWSSGGDAGPLAQLDDLRTRHATLTAQNVEQALLASAAVPLLLRGVAVEGDPKGVYRDAGILDYHPLLGYGRDALVLYPHFYSHLIPGWFDRWLPHRGVGLGSSRRSDARSRVLDRTVVLAPSDAFVARLPGGERPSRGDARRFSDAARIRRWRTVWQRSSDLGQALGELLESPRLAAEAAEPLVV